MTFKYCKTREGTIPYSQSRRASMKLCLLHSQQQKHCQNKSLKRNFTCKDFEVELYITRKRMIYLLFVLHGEMFLHPHINDKEREVDDEENQVKLVL